MIIYLFINVSRPKLLLVFTLQNNREGSKTSNSRPHRCHRPFCPWGPFPDSPAQCPGSSGGPTLALCPPRRRPPQSRPRSPAGRSGPCHPARSRWPEGSKQTRNESESKDEHVGENANFSQHQQLQAVRQQQSRICSDDRDPPESTDNTSEQQS